MQWVGWRLAGRRLLSALAAAKPDGFFIEIGANDGRQGDPLRRTILASRWRGIMVEPQPDAFGRLRLNYAENERVILENVAITDHDGRVAFYELAPPAEGAPTELFGSYDLLGSLSREVLLEHDWISDAEHRIVRTEVDCMRLETLCRKHAVDSLDLLKVDIEGHDHVVVRQIEGSGLRPRVVAYEHALLSSELREECRRIARGLGYELMEELFDTWCFDASIHDRLTEKWRRLRPVAPAVVLRES
jgi:FkbM family methyltransferase